MIRIAVVGSAGRMGRRLVALIAASKDLKLSGATEIGGSPFIGQDAGLVAGCGECRVKITGDLAAALEGADTMIDFSTGDVAENVRTASSKGVACVVGTTALGQEGRKAFAKFAGEGARIVHAPNMSVGINLLLKISEEVARTLGDDYDIEIVEMHHNRKKDAPSGTAISLAEAVCKGRELSYAENAVHGREGLVGERKKTEVGMHALRGGDVVGDHTVIFAAEGERIELTHRASSRDTFAKGALRAARFIAGAKPGLYDMRDVIGLN